MRILILGTNYSAKIFYNLFKKDKNNIVFSTLTNKDFCVDFRETKDIVEFCEANEINLVLIIDEEYINLGLQEILSSKNISAFSPSIEAIGICASKSAAKKFMYKNKIKTPKFLIAEKPQVAVEYFKQTNTPQVIKPDNHSYQECSLACETLNSAQKIINDFFNSGNKKIVIEDYIEGKNISIWVLSDGYSAKIIGKSAKYQNDIAYFNPEFIDEQLENRIYNEIIMPTIRALSTQDEEYIGILGFDIVLTYDNDLFLLGFNSFFDDINVDFYAKGYDINWAEVFDSVIIGDVFLKYQFKPKNEYMITIRQDEKIEFLSDKTKTNLKRYIKELEFNTVELEEALKRWKY